MTRGDIQARLVEIVVHRGDDERAHILESQLHLDVLRAIASMDEPTECNQKDDCTAPACLASTALQSLAVKFNRWHA